MAVARKFVEHCCLHNSAAGELKLRYWHGGWWAWRTTHWVEIKEREVRAVLYAFTEHAIYDIGLDFLPWLPNRKKIGDLLEALTVPTLLSNNTEQPCWLDHRDIAGPIVATTNGLLDIGTRTLHPHSPMLFNVTSVPFAYDPGAPKPQRWLDFLDVLWCCWVRSRRACCRGSFEYSDCWVDDARLVILNLIDASRRKGEETQGDDLHLVQPASGGFFSRRRSQARNSLAHDPRSRGRWDHQGAGCDRIRPRDRRPRRGFSEPTLQ